MGLPVWPRCWGGRPSAGGGGGNILETLLLVPLPLRKADSAEQRKPRTEEEVAAPAGWVCNFFALPMPYCSRAVEPPALRMRKPSGHRPGKGAVFFISSEPGVVFWVLWHWLVQIFSDRCGERGTLLEGNVACPDTGDALGKYREEKAGAGGMPSVH